MSQLERTGKRRLTYSAWHRPDAMAPHLEHVFRHIGDYRERRRQARIAADYCHMIDIDGCEYCARCKEPLALVETQCSTGMPKRAVVTGKLAEMALIPAFSLSYSADDADALISVRLTRIYPDEPPMRDLHLSADEYAAFVLGIHQSHRCSQ